MKSYHNPISTNFKNAKVLIVDDSDDQWLINQQALVSCAPIGGKPLHCHQFNTDFNLSDRFTEIGSVRITRLLFLPNAFV